MDLVTDATALSFSLRSQLAFLASVNITYLQFDHDEIVLPALHALCIGYLGIFIAH